MSTTDEKTEYFDENVKEFLEKPVNKVCFLRMGTGEDDMDFSYDDPGKGSGRVVMCKNKGLIFFPSLRHVRGTLQYGKQISILSKAANGEMKGTKGDFLDFRKLVEQLSDDEKKIVNETIGFLLKHRAQLSEWDQFMDNKTSFRWPEKTKKRGLMTNKETMDYYLESGVKI